MPENIQNCNFKKSNMADGRHLEKSIIRHISATDWPILMKFSISFVSQSYWPLRIWFFENPRWRRPPFWKSEKSKYLCNHLTDFDEIWHGDAHWQFLCRRTFKIAILKIQHGGQPPSWKIENAPYLSNGLADLDEIWQAYADWVYQSYQLVKIEFLKIQDGGDRHFGKR